LNVMGLTHRTDEAAAGGQLRQKRRRHRRGRGGEADAAIRGRGG